MDTDVDTVYWTACNNSSRLKGRRKAVTMRAAVRDARRYVAYELYGEGAITYTDEAGNVIREEEKSSWTNNIWRTV